MEKTVFPACSIGEAGQLQKSMNLEHSLTPYTKINSKQLKNLNIRHNVIKLLRENICKILSDRNHSNTFLGQSPKAKQINAKINKWDLIRLISFYLAKETINKLERQPTDWEEKYANNVTDKGLIFNMYKQLIQLNIKKQTTQSKNVGRGSKQTILQRRHPDGQQTHEKIFNITNHQRNKRQSYNEVPLHTGQSGRH